MNLCYPLRMEAWVIPVVGLTAFLFGVLAGMSFDTRWRDRHLEAVEQLAGERAVSLERGATIARLNDEIAALRAAQTGEHDRTLQIIDKVTELVYPDVTPAPDPVTIDDEDGDEDLGWERALEVDDDPIGEWGMDARDLHGIPEPEEYDL